MKIKYYISPDKVISCMEEIPELSVDHFCIVDQSKISIVKKNIHRNAVQYKTMFSIDMNTFKIKDRSIYRSVNHHINTNEFGNKFFIEEKTVRGILESYISATIASPHIILCKNEEMLLVKTTYKTLFMNKTYPMIVNKNFKNIIIDEFSEMAAEMEVAEKRMVNFLDRHI